jgi:hypothetical protein
MHAHCSLQFMNADADSMCTADLQMQLDQLLVGCSVVTSQESSDRGIQNKEISRQHCSRGLGRGGTQHWYVHGMSVPLTVGYRGECLCRSLVRIAGNCCVGSTLISRCGLLGQTASAREECRSPLSHDVSATRDTALEHSLCLTPFTPGDVRRRDGQAVGTLSLRCSQHERLRSLQEVG